MARFVFVFLSFVSFVVQASGADPTYWKDIRPVFRKHCISCHNAKNVEEVEVSGGLALDSYAAVRKGAQLPVIRVGKSGASRLVKMVTRKDAENRMPLAAPPLDEASIALIRRWIDTGAKEGTRPEETSAVATSRPGRRRKLDVTLAAGVAGKGGPGPVSLTLQVGPLAPVTAVAFSPDAGPGKGLLATGTYGQVAVWDLAAARPVKLLTNVLGAVNDVRFSPDGKLLAVAGGQPSAKGDLRLYRVADWKLLGVLRGHNDVVFTVAFSPDGKRLASASFDRTVRLWDVAGRRLLRSLTGHSDFVYAVAFGPEGKWLASASKDRSVKLANPATGKGLFTFTGMNEDVLAVAVSPDGRHVVSSGFESGLYWWNPKAGVRERVVPGHGGAVHEVAFSKDGKTLVSGSADRTVRLWDGRTGSPRRVLPVGAVVYAVAVSPDGRLVASGSFDGLVRVWDAAIGKLLATLLTLPAHQDRADWLALTPAGYVARSPGLGTPGRWRVAGREVPADRAWQTLGRPELVARVLAGQSVAPPTFGK